MFAWATSRDALAFVNTLQKHTHERNGLQMIKTANRVQNFL
jgi:hypothetical protein